MATRTIANAGGVWASSSTWVEGIVPTSSDDVVATASSGSVNMVGPAYCKSANFTSYTGTLSHSSGANWYVYGNLTFVAGMTYAPTADACAIYLSGTGSLTTAGKQLGNVTVDGAGITATLQDTLTLRASTTTLTLTQGTLNTNNQAVNVGIFNQTNSSSYITILTLGSSTMTCSTRFGVSDLNNKFTLNCNTSLVRLTGASYVLSNTRALTFYDVEITGGGSISSTGNYALTFHNLTYTGTAAKTNVLFTYHSSVEYSCNITTSNNLTINGNSAVNRVGVLCLQHHGRTITCNGTATITNADFKNITTAGSAGSWNLASTISGNCGGNTGITFTTADDMYWHEGTGNFSDSKWYLATNGGGGSGRVPLPQDTAYFDASSFDSAGRVITQDMPRIGNVVWTGAANSPTFAINSLIFLCGGTLTLISGMTLTSDKKIFFISPGTITSAGKSFGGDISFQARGGDITIADNFVTTGDFISNEGGLDINGDVTCAQLGCYYFMGGATGRTFNLGSGTINCTSTYFTTYYNTINCETSSIAVSNSTTSEKQCIFYLYSSSYPLTLYNYSLGGTGTGGYYLNKTGSAKVTLYSLTITGVRTVRFSTLSTWTILEHFHALGSAGNLITINSSTSGSYASLIKTATGATWNVGSHSVNVSGNTGLTFSADPLGYMDYCSFRDIHATLDSSTVAVTALAITSAVGTPVESTSTSFAATALAITSSLSAATYTSFADISVSALALTSHLGTVAVDFSIYFSADAFTIAAAIPEPTYDISSEYGSELIDAKIHLKLNDNEEEESTVVNDGSLVEDATASTATGALSEEGKIEKCFAFRGEYNVDLSMYVNNIKSDASGSVSFWVYSAATTGFRYIFSITSSSFDAFYVQFQTSRKLYVFFFSEGTPYWTWLTGILPEKEWCLVSIVQDGVSAVVKVDNVVSGDFVFDIDKGKWLSSMTGIDSFLLGKHNTYYFHSSLDDFRYYSEALSDENTSDLYNDGDGTEDALLREHIVLPMELTVVDPYVEDFIAFDTFNATVLEMASSVGAPRIKDPHWNTQTNDTETWTKGSAAAASWTKRVPGNNVWTK